MDALHKIDLALISAHNATDQQPITLHYGQHFATHSQHHQRTYSHYPTAASEIINPQQINKPNYHSTAQFHNHNSAKLTQSDNVKLRSNSVHKILTVRQIKQASRKLDKMLHNPQLNQANRNNYRNTRIELGGRWGSKKIQLSKYLQQNGPDLLPS